MNQLRPLLALIPGFLCAAAVAKPPPAEAYGRLPAIGSAALSPDGKRVALALGFEYQDANPDSALTAMRVVNIDNGKIEHTLAPPAGNTMRDVDWADEGRATYSLSEPADLSDEYGKMIKTRRRNPRVVFFRGYVLPLDTGTPVAMMRDSQFRYSSNLSNLIAPIEGDPGFGRMVNFGGRFNAQGGWRLALYRVNLTNGSAESVMDGNEYTRQFMVDEKGDAVARIDVHDKQDRWRLFVYDKRKDRLLFEKVSEMGMPLTLRGMLPDGRFVATDPHEDGARDTLLAIDPKTGASTELHKTGGSDVGALTDPWTRRVVGAGWTDDLPKRHYFDAALQEIYAGLQSRFTDGYVRLQSWSRDRSRFLVFGEHADDAGAYYIYEPASQKLRLVGKIYPALDGNASLGERRAIRYKARDGTSVPAYLTLPAGVEPKRLPLVLLVHGGPHSRDTFTFDWWASFIASRGYAVLQVNFRGSTGYGYDWFNAGRGGWGTGIMQTDVEDGADALVKGGMVDAARICIMGGSYGGYAALAGVTLTPERYACAVSVNGVSDPEQMLIDATSGNRKTMVADWWRLSMGEDRKHLREISPMRRVAQVRAPVLLIHGEEDSVVPVEESRNFHAEMTRAGKKVRYVGLKGDDHWLSLAPTRTLMLREVETFLAEHLQKEGEVAR